MGTHDQLSFLSGIRSPIATLLREHASDAFMGSPEQWPAPIKAAISLMLGSGFPMSVAWGPPLNMVYNDSYAEVLGAKHPASWGQPFLEIWHEVAEKIRPLIAKVQAGETFYLENMPFTVRRNGFDEETWFTFSWSPIRDELSEVAGIFCACAETTRTVLAEQHERAEHDRLAALLQEAPGFLAVLRGPQHVMENFNAAYEQLVGYRNLRGLPVAVSLPEVAEQGFIALLDQVYTSGEAFRGSAVEVSLNRTPGGPPVQAFVDFVYQPLRDVTGDVYGILVQGHEVTALRRNTALFSQIIEQAPGGVYVVDSQFRLTHVNAGALPAFASVQPLIGRNFDEVMEILWGPEIGPHLASIFRHTLATGERYVSPRFSEHRSDLGVEQAFEWEAQRITLPDGQHGVVCYFQDVTARELADAARRESEDRLSLAVKSSQVVLFQQDLDLRYTWLQNAVPGFDGSEAVGKRDADLMERAADAAVVEALKREVIRSGVSQRQEVLVHISGVGRHYDLLVEPLQDAAGLICGVTCAAIDITERKRMEEARHETERNYQALAAASSEITYRMSADWSTMLPLNGRHLVLSTDKPLANWEWLDQNVPRDEHPRVRQAISDAIAGKTLFELEHRVRRPDGSIGWTLSRAVPILNENGEVITWFGAAGDITERKAAEEALRENEERLQKVISVQNVGVLFFKLDGQMHDANGALERMSGYTADELRRITDWAQLTPPEFMDVTRRAAAELAERGDTAPYEKQWTRKDGSRFWGLFSPTRLSGSGSESECVEFTIDISEIKRAEEQLRAHRQLLETMVNHLPAAVALIRGSDLTFQMVNPGYQAISPGKQMVGKTISGVWPETHPLFGQRCRHVLETGEPFEADDERYEIHRDSDGPPETAYFSWSMRRVHLPDETQPGLLLTLWETTARKEIELTLAERTALLSGVLEGTSDVIFVKDMNGGMLLVNAAFAAAAGSTPELLVGKTDADWFPPDVAAAVRQQDEAVMAGGSPMEFEETLPVAGKPRVFLTLKAPLRDGSGRVIGILGIGRDITDRKRAEDKLHRLAAELSDADRRKDVFLATLAHELRNPLAPMRNGLQIMKLTKHNSDAAEQVRAMIDRQLSQLVRLVDDLLDVSRITQGKVELRVERIDLKTVLAAALEASRPAIKEAGHELTVVVPDAPIFVDGDSARLAQAVSNLLNNSAKYTRRGGHIRMTVWREDGMAVVAVKDNGIGIPPAMLDRVFEMFTQVDRSLEKTAGGLGIGLSLVKGLLEMHGGTVEAMSDGEGMGSEFVVRLPVVTSVIAGPQRESGESIGVVPSAPRRILVVDDNVDSADSLAQMLEMLGNEVRTAYDGEAGIAAAAQFRPDLVLMDIGMPKLNGYEAARRIRQLPSGAAMLLVALTGWGQEDDRRKSADAGFNDHLVKPVDVDTLIKLISGS